NTRQWLERRVIILRALHAGKFWDPFLEEYADFERWDSAYGDVRKLRDLAVQESINEHLTNGKRLATEKDYAQSLAELRKARERSPSDKQISDLIENVSLEDARSHARLVRATEVKDPDLALRISRFLNRADAFIKDKSWEEAESQIAQA